MNFDMDTITLVMLASLLIVGWLVAPVIILQYRKNVLPKRYDEIRDQFLRQAPAGASVVEGDRGQTAAWHYARLHDPDSRETHDETPLKKEFNYYQGRERYVIPLWLVLILSGLMLAFTGVWVAERLNLTGDLSGGWLARVDSSFVMAILGALVWSLYETLSRGKSGDLTPVELYDVILRYVTAIPIGYAFSLLVFDRASPWLSFTVSAFPLRDIRQLIRKQALRKLGETPVPGASAANPCYIGQVLSSIGDDTIVRLEELNIATCLDLAYTDPVRLLIKTGAPIKLVLAWIDKALVAVYAAPHVSKLERLGLPCALDLCEFYVRHCWDLENKRDRNWAADSAVKALADKLEIPMELLVPHVLNGIFTDPHTQFLIRVWYGPATSANGL